MKYKKEKSEEDIYTDEIKMVIGENLRKIRKANSLSGEAFAEKIGLSRTTVSNFENGVKLIKVTNIKRIAEIFKVSIDALLSKNFEPQAINIRDSDASLLIDMIRKFRFNVELIEDNRITISLPESDPSYGQYHVSEFIKKYKYIQDSEENEIKRSKKELINDLIKEYEYIPKLPDYDIIIKHNKTHKK